jgi:cysteinyl-tRNA synthetase
MWLYNTLTKCKEEFIPLEPNKIKMYVCGQTVYDYCHLGHGRKAIVFDMIRRWLIACGYHVTFVENITDIDDKIINRAKENNETIYQLTDRFIQYMYEDFARLGIMPPDIAPRATQYIPQMILIIEDLLAKGIAYRAKNNDIYYKVEQFPNYGQLSGKILTQLNAGERVDIDENKENPLDFVLWKHVINDNVSWDAPFGRGRPGWHIECSAMAGEILGKTFDIHGGGQDLQFPHHENEIAQSEAHYNCKFANYWLHNGFLNINDEKMSKSLGNFKTIRQILDEYDAEVIRFFILKTHYRSPLNLNYKLLDDAKNIVNKFYISLNNYQLDANYTVDWNDSYAKRFKQAMDDDFNTPLAFSILFELLNELNTKNDLYLANLLYKLLSSLGCLQTSIKDYLQPSLNLDLDIENMIKIRDEAKKTKNYKLADEIRQKLFQFGISLEDTVNGTIWRKS